MYSLHVLRTERRPYPPQEDPGYGDPGMQQDPGYGNPGGYGSDPGYGSTGYPSGGRQDIDLDDDFNFDFIKPGK